MPPMCLTLHFAILFLRHLVTGIEKKVRSRLSEKSLRIGLKEYLEGHHLLGRGKPTHLECGKIRTPSVQFVAFPVSIASLAIQYPKGRT